MPNTLRIGKEYAPRYAQVMQQAHINFPTPHTDTLYYIKAKNVQDLYGKNIQLCLFYSPFLTQYHHHATAII